MSAWKRIQSFLETEPLTGIANWDHAYSVSMMVASDREVVKRYLVLLRIIEQLANVVTSQNAGLDGPLDQSARPNAIITHGNDIKDTHDVSVEDRRRC